jgi:hypothetical protein
MNLLINRNIDQEAGVVVHIKIIEVVIKETKNWFTKLKYPNKRMMTKAKILARNKFK